MEEAIALGVDATAVVLVLDAQLMSQLTGMVPAIFAFEILRQESDTELF